jgi:two-component system, chemotaxis family, protein-glutamate methylesterase/glutaminase
MPEPKFLIVVGASAGGIIAVTELFSQLKEEMNAAVLVVLHIQTISNETILMERFESQSKFKCKLAEDNESLKKGTIYIAAPEKHLLVKDGKIMLGYGAKENRWRPSIDVLFRSAAANYGSRVIGIILTGLMNDGTAGMSAIKKSGGTCIVQDPDETEYPDMALSVLQNIDVDYCVRLEEMGLILQEKTRNGYVEMPIPEDIKTEARIAERMAMGIEVVASLGEHSNYICPDCGGGLWQVINEHMVRFRCHTGHAFTADELLIRQSEGLENTLFTAIRMMEERKNLLEKMANEESKKGWKKTAESKIERVNELDQHINRLKKIIFESNEV